MAKWINFGNNKLLNLDTGSMMTISSFPRLVDSKLVLTYTIMINNLEMIACFENLDSVNDAFKHIMELIGHENISKIEFKGVISETKEALPSTAEALESLYLQRAADLGVSPTPDPGS